MFFKTNNHISCNVCFCNHLRVSSGEKHLTIRDTHIVAAFEQECVSRPNDQQPIFAKLEYVGWIEEIL
jgi:hypothetical protein